jgi:hypothetical protein
LAFYPCRLINDLDIQMSPHSTSDHPKTRAGREVSLTVLLLLSKPLVRFRKAAILQPTIWIAYHDAMQNVFDRSGGKSCAY